MKKPGNTGAALKTRTASWQYDSMDLAEGMDNSNHPSYKKLTKYSGNQHGGSAEGNFGRAAANLKGNTGATANAGPKQPAVSSVPALPAQGSVRDSINRGAQVRNPGGVKEMPKRGKESFDMGRGPTRGNQQ
jgi:hypothetical protein